MACPPIPNLAECAESASRLAGRDAAARAPRTARSTSTFLCPISNLPDEPIRIKWIRETYELLKAILPPRAVDTPLELAQLSQFVINIVDYRDTDATMTRFVNPDISAVTRHGRSQAASRAASIRPSVTFADPPGSGNLVQFGMEYTPVAINEVLAYSFTYKATSSSQPANRLFVEMVNTLTEASAAQHGQPARPDRLEDDHITRRSPRAARPRHGPDPGLGARRDGELAGAAQSRSSRCRSAERARDRACLFRCSPCGRRPREPMATGASTT